MYRRCLQEEISLFIIVPFGGFGKEKLNEPFGRFIAKSKCLDVADLNRMSSLSERKFVCRVSSTLNRDTKQFGKKHLFDDREETCWNSDQVSQNDVLAWSVFHGSGLLFHQRKVIPI